MVLLELCFIKSYDLKLRFDDKDYNINNNDKEGKLIGMYNCFDLLIVD